MLYKIKYFFIIILIIASNLANAQKQEDLQLWANFGLSKEIKDFEFTYEQELRLFQNISEVEMYFSDFGISYSLNKHVDFKTNYRIKKSHTDIDLYEYSHRFNYDIKLSEKKKRFKFSYKIRFQTQIDNFLYINKTDFFESKLRNKFKCSYNLRHTKIEPFGSMEFFNDANTYRLEFSKIRLTAGVSYSKKKIGKISVFYRIEKQLQTDIPKNDYIIGTSYSFNLK